MQELRSIRLKRGYTQTQLADAIGVNQQIVSKYECGLCYPSIPVVAKICQFLGCSLLDLFGVDSYSKVV